MGAGHPRTTGTSWLDANAVQRGSALFASGGTGCITCHSGPKFTNNQTMNVSTCGLFQVPPLVGVGWRAPFLHNGCAATLADRFGKCATTGHGNLSQLASGDVTDLVQYLESL
jgi:cytochrome c peroxidase